MFLRGSRIVSSFRTHLFRKAVLAGAAAVSAAAFTLPATTAQASLFGSSSPYIISEPAGSTSGVLSALSSVGATVTSTLSFVNAVTAQLTPFEVTLLNLLPGVVVTPDVTVAVQGSIPPPGRPAASVYPQESGATQLWSQGDEGSGVNVAVLDTGIDPVADLAGRVVGGVDLSGEGNALKDSYGHGTFVAGLIASDGASSSGQYMGEAPGAGLVSVKVAGTSGQTDLATVLAGVGWTIANRGADNIRVLNMSLGYLPILSTALDPLDQAVEKAWESGIVVVTSAGNSGPSNGTILSPGDDPLVITVGALDDQGTVSTADDSMTSFSSVGPTSPDGWFKPDLVASGRSVVSLRAPGSTIDTQYPSARIGSSNFVGSGTSFSAGVVSGSVALFLEQHPSATPNEVKAALLGTAAPGPVGNPFVDGHGALNVAAATAAPPMALTQSAPLLPTLFGQTVQLENTWSASSWNPSNWTGTAWNGTAWNGTAWNGTAWNGTAWNGTAWNGTAWNSTAWNGTAWNGTAWNGTAWNGTAWNGTAWNGSAWN